MNSRLNLHDELRRPSFDHAVLCTYGFQPAFFEDYCLESFDSLNGNNNITILMDGGQYDEIVSAPRALWPRQANLRYLLRPVRPRGRFHPKVYLFSSREKALLAIGSANLTRPGLTRNAELMAVFRFERGKKEDAAPLFGAAWSFISQIAARWPSPALESNLVDLESEAPWKAATLRESGGVQFVHNLNEPLFPRLIQGISGSADQVLVLSPFFDAQPALLDWIDRMIRPERVGIYTQNGLTTMTPEWLNHPRLRVKGALRFCDWSDDSHPQDLHAKALAITYGDRVRLAFGSANFTRAALLSTPSGGNVESMLVLDLPQKSVDVARLFDPDGTARSGALKPCVRAVGPAPREHDFMLDEAWLDGCTLNCCVRAGVDPSLDAVLEFGDGAVVAAPLRLRGDCLIAVLVPEVASRCDSGAVVVRVEGKDGPDVSRRSNGVLLVNLKDAESGRSTARERRIREAERSAEEFASALTELLKLEDRDSLLTFLTHCDIPVVGAARLTGFGRGRSLLAEVQLELRSIGERNLRDYASLHEAAFGFCGRHLARLQRQARRPILESAPSCTHLTRAVSQVLFVQTERILAGIESGPVLRPESWFACRVHLDTYLRLYLDLIDAAHEWLEQLDMLYGTADVRNAVRIDMAPLSEFVDAFLNVRSRVDAARQRARVQVPAGPRVVPPVMEDNVISDRRWRAWAGELASRAALFERFAS